MRKRVDGPIWERIMERVSPCPVTGCWWWIGAVNNQGYGRISRVEKPQGEYVHRVVLELKLGRPLLGLALHSCDNGRAGCVNPNHLREGTHKDNTADCLARGRMSSGQKHGEIIKRCWAKRRGATNSGETSPVAASR